MPPPDVLLDRCSPCWLPGSHTIAEHLDNPDPAPADLDAYGIWPPARPVDATLTG